MSVLIANVDDITHEQLFDSSRQQFGCKQMCKIADHGTPIALWNKSRNAFVGILYAREKCREKTADDPPLFHGNYEDFNKYRIPVHVKFFNEPLSAEYVRRFCGVSDEHKNNLCKTMIGPIKPAFYKGDDSLVLERFCALVNSHEKRVDFM